MKSCVLLTICFLLIFLNTTIVLATSYEYDNLHRLTRVTYDNGMQITYTYDEVGNRTQRVSTLMADASIDGKVDFQDFAILATKWLQGNCAYADEWCEKADLNWSSEVDFDDLATLAEHWLETTAP